MTYTETVYINEDEFNRVKHLLEDFDCFYDLTDDEIEKEGIKFYDCINLFSVEFQNGNKLTYDVISGRNNYYDDVWMFYPNNDAEEFECSFELSREVTVESKDGDTYTVIIELEREN